MKFLFVIFLLPLRLLAQDVTGVWAGTLYNDTTKQYLKYELAISENSGKLSGYSHTTFIIDGIENIGVKSIKIKKSGNVYLVEDDKLIYNNYTEPPAKGVRTYSDLELTETDSLMILKGSWKTNTTRNYRSITGNIFLKKKKDVGETLIIPELQNLGLTKSLSFMPYDNFSKDMAITNTPVDKLSVGIKQNQNTEVNSPSNNNVSLKSNGNKQIESNVKPLSKDTQKVAVANNTIANPPLNKINENNIVKNIAIGNQIINPLMNKNAEAKTDETPKGTDSNITSIAGPKKQMDNKIKTEISGLKKNIDTTTSVNRASVVKKESINNIRKIDNESSANINSGIVQKEVSKVPSKNKEAENFVMKEKEQQINPVKTLDKNYGTINSNVSPFSKAAADISSRKIETVQSVEIKNDSLSLTLYDNGEIDGDTVSILLNGKVIMPMQGLTAKGISKTIYLTPEMGDSISLIMYAENLGSIPPNTGLLIVYDGNVRHEIRFSGDLKKNSAIILKRKRLQ